MPYLLEENLLGLLGNKAIEQEPKNEEGVIDHFNS
jgi:hypothetical protein